MKVSELLERANNIQHIEIKKFPNFSNLDLLGSGTEATVYKSRGNTAIKTVHIENTNNATYQYINMIMDHQENLFFPKIYSAKLYNSDVGYMLVINMEKLTPFGAGSTGNNKAAHLYPILMKQLGIKELITDIDNHIDDDDITGRNYDKVVQMGSKLSSMFSSEFGRNEIINKTNNPQLKQALELTGQIADQPGSGGDLHDENVMVRLTGHGPQLVIVDPVLTY